jgi:transposase, IS5 family
MPIVKLPNSYLSTDAYAAFIDRDHFLCRLGREFDWHDLAGPLKALGANDAGGRPRHPAVLMLKMTFVSYLFGLSDRDTEFAGTNNLLVKHFLGLPIDGRAPDHSSLCRFREEVVASLGQGFLLGLFRRLVAQAKAKGVEPSSVQALDATHAFADADAHAPRDTRTPRDPDASWGCKGDEPRTTSDGRRVMVPKFFLGYKAHLLADSRHGLVTGFHATTGRTADIDGGDELLHRVMAGDELAGVSVLLADKGYGCPVMVNMLERFDGVMTAFSLPESRKGWRNPGKWAAYEADPGRRAFRRDRYVVERVNASLKRHHGLGRARYLGLPKFGFQLAMSAMAHNLKIYMRLLTGARLRPA